MAARDQDQACRNTAPPRRPISVFLPSYQLFWASCLPTRKLHAASWHGQNHLFLILKITFCWIGSFYELKLYVTCSSVLHSQMSLLFTYVTLVHICHPCSHMSPLFTNVTFCIPYCPSKRNKERSLGIVETDYAQGQFHSTKTPTDSVWSTSYKTERLVLGNLGGQSTYAVYTSPKSIYSSWDWRGGSSKTTEWSWPYPLVGTLFLPWSSEATLAIWSERFSKIPYQENNYAGIETWTRNPYIILLTHGATQRIGCFRSLTV